MTFVIPNALHFLILDEDNPPFTLEQLYVRMKNFSYSEEEKANKPKPISEDHLKHSYNTCIVGYVS